MNFLLHAHLAALELGDPLSAVGAALPDLWRMAHRRSRSPRASESANALERGVAHHVAADDWYHSTTIAGDGEQALRLALGEACPNTPKAVLLGHALWELLLDGALVRATEGRAARDLGTSLAAARDDVFACTEALAVAPRAPLARAMFEVHFARIVRGLVERSWPLAYAQAEGLAASFDGMRALLGLSPTHERDAPRLLAVLTTFAPRADACLVEVLDARRRFVEAAPHAPS